MKLLIPLLSLAGLGKAANYADYADPLDRPVCRKALIGNLGFCNFFTLCNFRPNASNPKSKMARVHCARTCQAMRDNYPVGACTDKHKNKNTCTWYNEDRTNNRVCYQQSGAKGAARGIANKCTSVGGWSTGASAWHPNWLVNPSGKCRISQGWIQGTVHSGSMTFNGIPYANPPIGGLRFRKTQRHTKWSGTFDATMSSDQVPGCPQNPADNMAPSSMSEDCLTINVHMPHYSSFSGSSDTRPVMFFIHGGAYYAGYGGDKLYDAQKYASEEGVIVVTFNYRLGALGFMRCAAAGAFAPGNQAMHDTYEALRWTRRNIHHFYGDASKITVVGQSAGAQTAAAMLAAKPNSKAGLGADFDKVILQSMPWSLPFRTIAQQEVMTMQLMYHLNCHTAANPIACALGKHHMELVQAQHACNGAMVVSPGPPMVVKMTSIFEAWTPTIDNDMLDMDVFDAIRSGRGNKKNMMLGGTSGELTFFMFYVYTATPFAAYFPQSSWSEQDYYNGVGLLFRGHAANLLPMYPYPCYPGNPMGPYCDARFQAANVATAGCMLCPNRAVQDAKMADKSKSGQTFMYMFDHPVPKLSILNPAFEQICTYSSCHGSDLPSTFGSFDSTNTPATQAERDLSGKMRKYWANFMYSGDPNQTGGVTQTGNTQSLDCWQEYSDQSTDTCGDGNSHAAKHIQTFKTGTSYFCKPGGTAQLHNECDLWDDINQDGSMTDIYGDY